MTVLIAYLVVVLTWSTTPLAIVWSSESIDPILAAFLRMAIAAMLGMVALLLFRLKLSWHKPALQVYGYSLLGVFGSMLCSYLAARYLASGLMSLLFGLSPILSGLIAQKLINEPKFGPVRWSAIVISLFGLAVICTDGVYLEDKGWIGICLILFAVLLFSISGVLIKKVDANLNPLVTTVGTLLLSLPLYFLTWVFFGGELNYEAWQPKAIISVLYLGVFGSFLAFIAYFYILNKLSASTVTLVTLITPVIAITLGTLLNNEPLNSSLVLGALCVLVGLALYIWHSKVKRMFTKSKTVQHPTEY